MTYGARERLATALEQGDRIVALILEEPGKPPVRPLGRLCVVDHVQRVEDDEGHREVVVWFVPRRGGNNVVYYRPGQRLLVLTEDGGAS